MPGQRLKACSRITTLPLGETYDETVSEPPAAFITIKSARDCLSERWSKVSGFAPIVLRRGKSGRRKTVRKGRKRTRGSGLTAGAIAIATFSDSWPPAARTSLRSGRRSESARRAAPVRLSFRSQGRRFGPPFELSRNGGKLKGPSCPW